MEMSIKLYIYSSIQHFDNLKLRILFIIQYTGNYSILIYK